jgi:hypothetical protein
VESGALQLSLFDLVCENITSGFGDSMNSHITISADSLCDIYADSWKDHQKYEENERKRKEAERGKNPERRSQRLRELIQGMTTKRG